MDSATLETILPSAGKGRKGKVILSKNCFSPENALILYQYLKLSLLDVNNWSRHKSGIVINAKLVDRDGGQVGRIAQAGDRIKIILPRWQSIFRVYDWFEVRRIEERLSGHIEIFFVTLLPCADPKADVLEPIELSKKESSVTIFVIRDKHLVELQIHTRDRGVKLNGGMKARIENIVYALLVQNRFYQRQWEKLLKSILNEGTSNFTNLN